MDALLNWGIIGTGGIARAFATGVAHSKLGRIVAVGSRAQPSAEMFAKQYGVPRAHGSYEALLADPQVRAVYIATPHPQHVEWVIKAAKADKHVLCEKPLSLTRPEAVLAVEACQANGVLLMEAFMYRCHPQTARIVEVVRSGILGRIGLVQAAFGFANAFDATNRFWNKAQGGGGILDVGCYPVSFSRLIAGADVGETFSDPISVTGSVHLDPRTQVDAWAAATLQFATVMLSQVSTSISLTQDNSARVYGTEGWLHIPEPWLPGKEGKPVTILHYRGADSTPERIAIPSPGWLYGLEADAFADALSRGEKSVPQMSIADTLGNMAVLDAWRGCASR